MTHAQEEDEWEWTCECDPPPGRLIFMAGIFFACGTCHSVERLDHIPSDDLERKVTLVFADGGEVTAGILNRSEDRMLMRGARKRGR